MYTQSSKEFIKKFFESKFEIENFKEFISRLLKTYEEINVEFKDFPICFKDKIDSVCKIGNYKEDNDSQMSILVVYIKDDKYIEKSRAVQRNIVKWYINQIDNRVSTAIAAFVPPCKKEWRLSLVKVDYDYDKNNNYKELVTPARRFSFLVGENEKSHTAQSRFISFLDKNYPPKLKEIEEAFSIEIITEEFFGLYRDLFIRIKREIDILLNDNIAIKNEFENKKISTVDFCKKLLGQILFVYFLQKKGWLGVKKGQAGEIGSKNFLRELFKKEYCNYTNFFNEILEPLFYDALRHDRRKYNNFYDRFNCKIPFLNGGLFDPINNYDWEHIDILLPNELFSNTNKTKEGDIGDGILDVFERYNFTVREDEPLEKEVAIDPELLGKIYERFNAIREDNFNNFIKAIGNKKENRFNKEFGVYYTPREIVHFMCKQSLLYYLRNEFYGKLSDETLENFIFYGEELFSEQEINENNLQKLIIEIKENAKEMDIKLSSISACDPAVGSGAFLVGLMGEIVKLRTLLSMFINKKEGDKNLKYNNEVIENNIYDFKRNCIENCLYGVDIDSGAVEIAKLRLWLSLIVDEEDINNIRPLPNLDYKVVAGDSLNFVNINDQNYKIFECIEKLKSQYAIESDADKKLDLKNKIINLFSQIPNSSNFEFKIHFSEVFHTKGGFDLILANPPYIQLQKNNSALAKKYEHLNFESFDKKGDIYCLFYEMGINMLKKEGMLCYISSNKWLSTEYGFKLRNLFKKYNPLLIINLGAGIFESATVDTCIFLLEKSSKKNFCGCNIKKEDIEQINILVKKAGNINHILNDNIWYIGNEMEYDLIRKINYNSKQLKDHKIKCNRGITTGYNSAFIITNEVKEQLLSTYDINEKQLLQTIIKPIVTGKDLKDYYYKWDNKYIINTGYDLNIKQYKYLYNYFQQYKNELKKRNDKGKNWWNLRACNYYEEFEKPKICWQRVAGKIIYSYIPSEYYVLDSAFFITGDNLEILLGILNSKVVHWWQKRMTTSLGSGSYAAKYAIIRTPIPELDKVNNKKIVDKIEEYVKEIININNVDEKKYKKLDNEINNLVYKLYKLTDDEIKIIEEDLK